VETGSLYPALHRLERQGWVRSGGSFGYNHGARYYQLTAGGQEAVDTSRAVEAVEVPPSQAS